MAASDLRGFPQAGAACGLALPSPSRLREGSFKPFALATRAPSRRRGGLGRAYHAQKHQPPPKQKARAILARAFFPMLCPAHRAESYWLFCRCRKRGMSSDESAPPCAFSSRCAPRAAFDIRSNSVPPSFTRGAGCAGTSPASLPGASQRRRASSLPGAGSTAAGCDGVAGAGMIVSAPSTSSSSAAGAGAGTGAGLATDAALLDATGPRPARARGRSRTRLLGGAAGAVLACGAGALGSLGR